MAKRAQSLKKKIQVKADKEINTSRQGIFPSMKLGSARKRKPHIRNVRSS